MTQRLRRIVIWLVAAIVMVAIGWTIWRAAAGTITVRNAAGVVGIFVSVTLVLVALVIVVGKRGGAVWAMFWFAMAAFGGGVVAPLWRMTTAPSLHAHETLSQERRELTLPEAPEDATYRLEIQAATPGPATNYILFVRIGDASERVESHHAATTSLFDVRLAEGQSLKLALEYSDGAVAVTLAEPPLPRWWFTILAVIATLLAVFADAISTAPKWRGLFTTVVASASVYAITMTYANSPTATSVLGTAVAAVFAGVIFAASTIGLSLLRRRRKRSRKLASGRRPAG